MTTIPEFQVTEKCSRCKGTCCKTMGCHFSPDDFKEISFESLKAEIEKGFISIDWWEGAEPEYFLRMRNKFQPIVDPSWGGECILLTPNGCPLPFEKRPLGARALEPKSTRQGCVQHYSKKQCKDDWKKYNDILVQLVEYFRKVDEEICRTTINY